MEIERSFNLCSNNNFQVILVINIFLCHNFWEFFCWSISSWWCAFQFQASFETHPCPSLVQQPFQGLHLGWRVDRCQGSEACTSWCRPTPSSLFQPWLLGSCQSPFPTQDWPQTPFEPWPKQGDREHQIASSFPCILPCGFRVSWIWSCGSCRSRASDKVAWTFPTSSCWSLKIGAVAFRGI